MEISKTTLRDEHGVFVHLPGRFVVPEIPGYVSREGARYLVEARPEARFIYERLWQLSALQTAKQWQKLANCEEVLPALFDVPKSPRKPAWFIQRWRLYDPDGAKPPCIFFVRHDFNGPNLSSLLLWWMRNMSWIDFRMGRKNKIGIELGLDRDGIEAFEKAFRAEEDRKMEARRTRMALMSRSLQI